MREMRTGLAAYLATGTRVEQPYYLTLLAEVMRTRGYPVDDFDQRAADISVDHPHVVDNYRTAHGIHLSEQHGDVDTEQQREAFVHYRALFEELLETTTGNGASKEANA